jgi:hypothetical protein
MLLSFCNVYAFKSRRVFSLAFSVAAFAWMTFWLGFYAETSPKTLPWSLPQDVFRLMGGRVFDREDLKDLKGDLPTYATMHSRFFSSHMAAFSLPARAPNFQNAVRLAVCLTALGFGLCLGMVVHITHRLCAKRHSVYAEEGAP